MRGYKLEYRTGKIPMVNSNLLVKDITDMELLEFWEDRLKDLGQPYVVAYKEVAGVIKYAIFTKIREKGSAFR